MPEKHQLITYQLEDGGQIQVIVPELSGDGIRLVARNTNTAQDALVKFEQSLSTIKQVANATLKNLTDVITQPDELAVEFGLLLSAEGNAIVVGGKIEGNIKVTITWKKGGKE